jgi:ribosomal protein L34E
MSGVKGRIMKQGTKIATCCYCGTRAALILQGKIQHELACTSCGAPLHSLKIMPVQQPQVKMQKAFEPPVSRPYPKYDRKKSKTKPIKTHNRKKSSTRRFFEEAFDVLDDIFD